MLATSPRKRGEVKDGDDNRGAMVVPSIRGLRIPCRGIDLGDFDCWALAKAGPKGEKTLANRQRQRRTT
jgi:hypothetical protein